MAKLYNLARMSTTTAGTGTITLGSAVTGFLSFAGAGVSNGETVTYAIEDGSSREIGRGVYTSAGTTLTRSVLKSTNSNNPISLSGTAQVIITPAAEDIVNTANNLSDLASASTALTNLTARGQGKETIFIPATAMVARTTNGAASGSVELSTNKVMVKSLDFDTTTQEFAQFSVWFPKSWNLGTVTFQPSFSQLTTAAGGVVFGLAGVAVSSTDDLDAAFGTAQTSTTTAGTLNKEYQGPESAAITIAGTPAAGDRVIFQINRTVADASDTLAQDARLHGVRLFFTTNAVTDA